MLKNAQKDFIRRHIGSSEKEQAKMLQDLGYKNLDELIEKTVPEKILLKDSLEIGDPNSEYKALRKLKNNIKNFQKSFNSINPLLCFSVKSNSNLQILKEVKKLGMGADVVSKGEMVQALKAGISPKKIVFSGVGKKTDELKFAIEKKILLINAESESEIFEIERLAKLKKTIVHYINHLPSYLVESRLYEPSETSGPTNGDRRSSLRIATGPSCKRFLKKIEPSSPDKDLSIILSG